MTGSARHNTFLSTDKIPLPYCPGCGHKVVVEALDAALVKLQPDPRKLVIVTDIGCIGLADRNFTTSAFHGLHGRSITYGCGLKLARPELQVVVLMGDGACGIGGTHLLNVARRNIGVTLIVANNFNYGMTGGQHSVTTPSGGATTTTPWGNVETPMDLCATVAAAGAPWVHRITTFEKRLPEILAQAISQPGFAMVDVWELCMAYYAPRNKVRKQQLLDLLDQCGFELGQLVDKTRPEYTARYQEACQAAETPRRRKPTIEPKFGNAVARQTGIIVAGSAGQKIKSAATLFAEAAIASNLHATQKDDYPITVMTGHSVAELIIGREPIEYTGICAPDYLLALSQDGVNRLRARIASLPASCHLYADEGVDLPPTKAQVHRYPFARTAKGIDRLSIGVVALATLLERTDLFTNGALQSIIRDHQKPKIAETNLKAAAAGAKL